MKSRVVLVVSMLWFALASRGMGEVLVFVDGSTLEVKSHELKDKLVVFENMQGRRFSVPRWYVMLDATMFRNHLASSETPLPTRLRVLPFEELPPVLRGSPLEMKAALHETYRLRPDRRFLRALEDIERILSGRVPKGRATVDFVSGRWRVRFGGQAVGWLPEYPDFSNCLALLVGFAKSRAQVHPVPRRASLDSSHRMEISGVFLPADLLARAATVDAAWRSGARREDRIAQMARILARLCLQMVDRLGIADGVPARAWATLAVALAVTSEPMRREEAMLAEAMGYTGHAETTAFQLPASDPLRLYLLREDEALEVLAFEERASTETRFLWLLRLGRHQIVENWWPAAQELLEDPSSALVFIKTGLELEDFSTSPMLAQMIPGAVHLSMAAERGESLESMQPPSRSQPEFGSDLIDGFEAELEGNAGLYDGPLLSREAYTAFYRAYFYSGLHTLGMHYLDRFASRRTSREFITSFSGARSHFMDGFVSWYSHLLSADSKEENLNPLIEDVTSRSSLGFPARLRSLDELDWSLPLADDMRPVRALRGLIPWMDTRLGHRKALYEKARYLLRDLRIEESLLQSIVSHSSSFDFENRLTLASLMEDEGSLRALLGSKRAPVAIRARALESLEKVGAKDDELRKEYEGLIEEDKDEWEIRFWYVDYLVGIEAYDDAQSVIEDWLERSERQGGFDTIGAHNQLARIYYEKGRCEEALAAVEPVIASYQQASLSWAIQILGKLGRWDEAVEIGLRAVERYPDNVYSRAQLAGIYWRRGQYDEAARVVVETPGGISYGDYSWQVLPRFYDALAAKPREEQQKAFQALIEAGFKNFELGYFGRVFSWHGDHETNLFLQSQIPLEPEDNEIEYLLDQYYWLKEYKGRSEAVEWLRSRMPTDHEYGNALAMYRHSELDLLWDLVDPSASEEPELIWLLRLAASVRQGLDEDPHRGELVRYFSERDPSKIQIQIGRQLLGMMSEEELLQYCNDQWRRAAASYYLGLKALSEGRYVDASDWFRVCVESDIRIIWERGYAFRLLQDWHRSPVSLSRFSGKESKLILGLN